LNIYLKIQGDDKPFDPTFLFDYCEHLIIWGGNYYADKLPASRGWIVWDKKGKEWDNTFADCEIAYTSFDMNAKIYRYIWAGLVREGNRDDELLKRLHPTQKPVGLFYNILTDNTDPKDIILDPFLGSGSTLIACQKADRICYGVEIEEIYCQIILDRWAKYTEQDPVRADGVQWSEIRNA